MALLRKALDPTAVLNPPVVLPREASSPTAVLEDPVVLTKERYLQPLHSMNR